MRESDKPQSFEDQLGAAIRKFGEMRKTPEGRAQLKANFENAAAKYAKTVREEGPVNNRPQFRISPKDRDQLITSSTA